MAVQRVDGVREARFSYADGSGTVTFDTTRTTPAAFIEELASLTGFEARVVRDP